VVSRNYENVNNGNNLKNLKVYSLIIWAQMDNAKYRDQWRYVRQMKSSLVFIYKYGCKSK
jgi:hypothetical protein